MVEQEVNIFLPFAKRRQGNCDHVQAMIEVFAETALANEIEQLHVAGGDDANVHLDRFRAAETHEFAFLNNAQELCLRLGSNRGNLIEKNRSLIGDFEEPLL